jgi:hypothetical protein
MIPYYHNAFSFRGFYDTGPHVTIFAYARPYEIIAHEATHGTIATLSSFGFLQQIAAYLRHFGDTCAFATERGNKIDAIIQERSVLVHEATAWLVSKLAENLDANIGFMPRAATVSDEPMVAPAEYKTEVARLRASLEAVPGKGFDKLEDCLNDYDPLFLTPSLLAISMASFALSPPFVKTLLQAPAKDFESNLSSSLSNPDENPLFRFHRLQDRIRSTDFAVADEWAKWVKRWKYGKPERCPVQLAALSGGSDRPADDDHSGYLRSQTGPEIFLELMMSLSEGRIPFESLATIDWKMMAERYLFEPHVVSHLQTCIMTKPKLIQDFYVKDPTPSEQIVRSSRYLNVSIGEEKDFRFNRFGQQRIDLTFGPNGPMDEKKRLVWRTDANSARSFLRNWAAQGKGIVTASIDYDLHRGDFLGRDVLKDLPHVVVAITDLRTLWLRMTDSERGGFKGARRIKVALVSCEEAPDLYAYLVFKSEASFPLVIIPVLLQSGQYVSRTIIGELRTAGYQLDAVPQSEIRAFVGNCEPSLTAAFYWLHGYFSE